MYSGRQDTNVWNRPATVIFTANIDGVEVAESNTTLDPIYLGI